MTMEEAKRSGIADRIKKVQAMGLEVLEAKQEGQQTLHLRVRDRAATTTLEYRWNAIKRAWQ